MHRQQTFKKTLAIVSIIGFLGWIIASLLKVDFADIAFALWFTVLGFGMLIAFYPGKKHKFNLLNSILFSLSIAVILLGILSFPLLATKLPFEADTKGVLTFKYIAVFLVVLVNLFQVVNIKEPKRKNYTILVGIGIVFALGLIFLPALQSVVEGGNVYYYSSQWVDYSTLRIEGPDVTYPITNQWHIFKVEPTTASPGNFVHIAPDEKIRKLYFRIIGVNENANVEYGYPYQNMDVCSSGLTETDKTNLIANGWQYKELSSSVCSDFGLTCCKFYHQIFDAGVVQKAWDKYIDEGKVTCKIFLEGPDLEVNGSTVGFTQGSFACRWPLSAISTARNKIYTEFYFWAPETKPEIKVPISVPQEEVKQEEQQIIEEQPSVTQSPSQQEQETPSQESERKTDWIMIATWAGGIIVVSLFILLIINLIPKKRKRR